MGETKNAWKRLVILHLVFSDKSVPEIKKRLKELKEAVEADPEFWEYYLPGLTEKEEK